MGWVHLIKNEEYFLVKEIQYSVKFKKVQYVRIFVQNIQLFINIIYRMWGNNSLYVKCTKLTLSSIWCRTGSTHMRLSMGLMRVEFIGLKTKTISYKMLKFSS